MFLLCFHENFTTDVSVDKNWLNIGSHPFPYPDPGICKDPSTLRDRAFFHNLADITGQTDHINMEIL